MSVNTVENEFTVHCVRRQIVAATSVYLVAEALQHRERLLLWSALSQGKHIANTIRRAQIDFPMNKTDTRAASESGSIGSEKAELDLTTLQFTAEEDRITEKTTSVDGHSDAALRYAEACTETVPMIF